MKEAQQYWPLHLVLILLCFSVGTFLITYGLLVPPPPNACNTPITYTKFDADITGNLTLTSPNITVNLGHCDCIEVYTYDEGPFTLKIIGPNGNPYASFPNFANFTAYQYYIELRLTYENYSLLAQRETNNASINLSVIATVTMPVLPCIDYYYRFHRGVLPLIGILLFAIGSYSTIRIYKILRYY